MNNVEELKKWRRDLHQIPEIGLKEVKTAAYIRSVLETLGYQWESIVETGTYVFIDNHQKETIAFRSDIDALEMTEKNHVDYVSKHEGMMHACGHDGHVSALLGLAKRLKNSKANFPHNILLIFQPAEESPGAAKYIVDSGLFEKYRVKAIFGMHLMPFIEEGKIACKEGPLMAMCGELDVTIHGKGAHAGLPQNGIDSIAIASDAIQRYQSLMARQMTPFQPVVLNIGKIQGGTARNSVASSTELHGTIRCYSEKIFESLNTHIERIHQGLEVSYGCHIDWSCPPLYPPVINDKKLYQKFITCVEDDYIELNEPLMLSEDFSYYQRAIPGIFFFLGTKSAKYTSGLHTETFNFNEEVLKKAVDLYYQLALHI